MRTLQVAYRHTPLYDIPVAADFKLKSPRRGFFAVTFADGGRGFLSADALISARVREILPEEDK